MKKKVFDYLNKLANNRLIVKTECINKAGRGNKYDFLIRQFYDDSTSQEFMVEFKFNASTINDAPQFVSPMKPSQYLNNSLASLEPKVASFEEYYYDHYLPRLSEAYNLNLPKKEEYLKQIHSNKPKCMKDYQDLYYKGCRASSQFTQKEEHIKLYNFAKELSNESISAFIYKSDLNAELLSNYLCETQKDKIYMLYSTVDKEFMMQKINMDNYRIVSVVKNASKFRYECLSKNGTKINVLLRWKNGNGIAFPAFQISVPSP